MHSTAATDRIETHLRALRQLAKHLVGNAHDAEDAVQETCLRAVERSSQPQRMRSWLETVLRNVIRRQHRTSNRRAHRESLAGERAAARPDPEDVAQRSRQIQALTDAVVALPSPLQDCITLRFFEGLTCAQIAERTGLSITEVYRHLDRGKQALRRRLAERDPNWRHSIALAAGLPMGFAPQPPEAPASTSLPLTHPLPTGFGLALGGAALIMKKSILAVAGLLLLWGAVYWSLDTNSETEKRENRVPGDPRPMVAATDQAAEMVEGSRAALPAPSERKPAAAPTRYAFELEVHLTNAEDQPAANAPLLIAPPNLPFHKLVVDADGIARLRFHGRQPTIELALRCPTATVTGQLRRVRLVSGTKQCVGMRVQAGAPKVFAVFRTSRTSEGRAIAPPRATPTIDLDAEGWGQFVQTSSTPPTDRRRLDEALAQVTLQLRGLESELAPGAALLRGTVRGANGLPVAKAAVRCGSAVTRSDARGGFELKVRASSSEAIECLAGGGDHGVASARLPFRRDIPMEWNPTLDRGLELRGQLTDPDGKALAGWRIELDCAPTTFVDGALADSQGRFAIPNLEDRGYRVLAYAPSQPIPELVVEGLRPGQFHQLATMQHHRPGKLRLRIGTADRSTGRRGTAQLWMQGTELGASLATIDPAPQPITPGTFRLVVQDDWGSAKDRTVQISPGETLSPAEFLLPEPAVLPWNASDNWQLERWTESLIARVSTKGAQKIVLPPGDYRLRNGDVSVPLRLVPGRQPRPECLGQPHRTEPGQPKTPAIVKFPNR